jgi:hypothetical protein
MLLLGRLVSRFFGPNVDNRVFISDGCNSFVYYGGIFDILFLSLFLLVAGAFVLAWCDNKKK